MIYLLDTVTVSDLIREYTRVTARLGQIGAADQVRICPIVRGEILHGIARLADGKRRRALRA